MSALVRFAGAKRAEWTALLEAEVTAGMRGVVTGVTCVAWFRPSAPRLALTPIVLVSSEEHGPRTRESGAATPEMDAGGIYSW